MSPRSRLYPSLTWIRARSGLLLAPGLILGISAGALADPPSLLDRAVVSAATRRAVTRAGLGTDAGRDLATRARAAGWIPQVSLRVARGAGSSSTQTVVVPDRAVSDDSLLVDVRVSLSLDRLVFDPSEIAIARVDMERAERRSQVEREVLELLAAMERARLEMQGLEGSTPEARRAQLDFARARARLELLTGAGLQDLLRAR